MQLPTLNLHRWLILAPLLDGAEKSFEQVRDAIGWETKQQSNLYTALARFHDAGLVRRIHVTTRRAVPTCRGQVIKNSVRFQITERGRQAWVEFADFCAFVGQRFAVDSPPASCVAPEPEVLRREIPIGGWSGWTTRRQGDGRATDDQYRQIVEASSPCLRRLLTGIRLMDVTVDEAIELQIADVDFTARLVRLQTADGTTRPIVIDGELAELLVSAIGKRAAGPVFVNYAGKPWKKANVYQHFRRVRFRLGFTAAVKIRGWTPAKTEDPAA